MSAPHEYLIDGQTYSVEIISFRDELVIAVNGKHYDVSNILHTKDELKLIEIDGELINTAAVDLPDAVHLKIDSKTYLIKKSGNYGALKREKISGNQIFASMPGILIEAFLKENDTVNEGDIILSTESMKMQTNITAPRDGIIEKIHFQKNDTFEKDATLVSLKEV